MKGKCVTSSKSFKTWSFFSGAMGLDLGFERSGLEPSLAVEIEPAFCKTIRENRPKLTVLNEDVTLLTSSSLQNKTGYEGQVDLMIGGPPCQSFSPGGKRAALTDPRGNLIVEYLRLIRDVRPRFFVLENVGNLVTAALRHRPINMRPGGKWNLSSYSKIAEKQAALFNPEKPEDNAPPAMEWDELSGSAIQFLFETAVADLGYSVSFGVLDASEFGAAQKRLRFVMIGARDEPAPALPQPTHGPLGNKPFVTVKDVIGDLYGDPGPGSLYTESVAKVFDLVPAGGNWRDLPTDVARTAMGEKSFAAGGGKTGFFRRLAWDDPSPTITGKANRKGSALCHPESTRPLSVKECARIQGFPDDWHISGAMNTQYTQIGNAVPLAIGEAVGRTIFESLSGRSTPEMRTQDQMLADAVQKVRSAARNKRVKT